MRNIQLGKIFCFKFDVKVNFKKTSFFYVTFQLTNSFKLIIDIAYKLPFSLTTEKQKQKLLYSKTFGVFPSKTL